MGYRISRVLAKSLTYTLDIKLFLVLNRMHTCHERANPSRTCIVAWLSIIYIDRICHASTLNISPESIIIFTIYANREQRTRFSSTCSNKNCRSSQKAWFSSVISCFLSISPRNIHKLIHTTLKLEINKKNIRTCSKRYIKTRKYFCNLARY